MATTPAPITQSTIRATIRNAIERGEIQLAHNPLSPNGSRVSEIFGLAAQAARGYLASTNGHLTTDLQHSSLSSGADFEAVRNAMRNGRR